MSAITPYGYIEFLEDPENPGRYYQLRDKAAQELLVHKVEKTIVNSLPAKPTTKDAWLAMEPFLYYLPIEGQANEYQCWTLFFVGDPTVASDYTNTNNYVWAKITDTAVDLTNFSTHGHTHEVIPETEVEDHDYKPEGVVKVELEDTDALTVDDTESNHQHHYTPAGSIVTDPSSSGIADDGNVKAFTGDQANITGGAHAHNVTPTEKFLKRRKVKTIPATESINPSTQDVSSEKFAKDNNNAYVGTYDADKSVVNGFTVDSDGVMHFKSRQFSKKTVLDTASTINSDATKTTIEDDNQTQSNNIEVDLVKELGASGNAADKVLQGVSVDESSSHSHTYTPTGKIRVKFNGTRGATESGEGAHQHKFKKAGVKSASFDGLRTNLKHKVDNKKVRTAPDIEDEGSHAFDWYGILFDEAGTDPIKTRVGNMDMHRTLPIQTKMRRCILDDNGEVKYYLDPNDSTKRAGSQEGYVTSEETFMSKVETDEIRDETEEIGVIKGNSCAWNQLVPNANINFTNTETDSKTYFNAIFQAITTEGSVIGSMYSSNISSSLVIKEIVETPSNIGRFVFKHNGTNRDLVITGNNDFKLGNHKLYLTFNVVSSNPSTVGGFVVKDVNIIDLTLMGIDSFTTTDQVEAYLKTNYGKTIFPFNSGTLLSNTMKGIQTVGFNKWDEICEIGGIDSETGANITSSTKLRTKNYIQVKPNTYYYFKNPVTGYYFAGRFYDSNKNYLGYIDGVGNQLLSGNKLIRTPSEAYYFRFVIYEEYGTTYNHDICINISDPAKNGTYEPYNLHSYQRDVTQITGVNPNTGVRELVAPNGLQKADMVGTVIDSIYNDSNGNAVCKKMCGDVDLGSLIWSYSSNYQIFINESFDGKTPTDFNTKPNYLCSKYKVSDANSVNSDTTKDKVLYVVTSLRIRDLSFNGDYAAFKTAMSGEHLIYELATPILYTDLQWGDGSPVILPIEIEVEKNSTIKIVPPHGDGGEELLMAAPTLQMKKYVLTQGANLDGSDGQVMVEIPEHWRKVYRYKDGDGDNAPYMVKAMISPYPQETTGWIHVKKNYISAYEACIIDNKLSSVSDVKNLVLSVVNGKVNATCDVSAASGQSDITSKLPTTNTTMAAFRTAARLRGEADEAKWNQLVYDTYIDVCWLYWIEYANLNSQAAFTTALTAEGFHQGGLGDGATTVSSGNWNTFNGYKPFVPCGITNCLGNQSGEVLLALPSTFGTNAKIAVNSYRGIELPFGHIWKFADGIKYLGDGTQQSVLRCDNPRNYSSDSASTNYISIGNNVGSDGWKKKIMIGDDGDINCAGVGGGSNQAYCDYNYQAHANGTYYCCLLGGAAALGSHAGLAFVHSFGGVSASSANIGSRLCFYDA